ncbi:MAG: DUF2752 domain-containing protein [Streptosporangiaceae bacterium]
MAVLAGRAVRQVASFSVTSVPGSYVRLCGVPVSLEMVVAHLLGLGCPFRDLTGLDCPGCGATRAFLSLFHGDLLTALHDNAVAVIVGAAIVPYVVLTALGWRVPERLARSFAGQRKWWFVLGACVAWTVIRNLPMFSWLAPDHPHWRWR